MPQISVIIPVYNSEKYLEQCLNSVFSQTFDEYEIIIVNDGSTDDSQKIIDSYKQKFPDKIKSLYQENKGQASARNNGLFHSSGEFVFFVDSDDYLEPCAFEKTYMVAKNSDSDIVCFGFFEVRDTVKKEMKYSFFEEKDISVRYILNETSPCNKLIRRKIFVENNLSFSESKIYEDLELIPQLALYTQKIEFMDERLYNYVIHQNSTMRQKVYNPKLASIYSVIDTLREKFANTKYHEELEYIYIEHLLHAAALRFLLYEEGRNDIYKISDIVKRTFPRWRENKYYKRMSFKYKIICNLVYLKQVRLLKFILGD